MHLKRLADMRQDRDLQQAEIAALLHTTQPQYSRYERGERDLPLSHLIALAQFYNTSSDYLLGLTNDPRPVKEIVGK